MLSLFPQILFLAPAGIMLLRIAAGICFLYMTRFYWQERESLSGLGVPVIGHLQPWMVVLSAGITALVAVLLILGAWTQGVAIVGALIALKQMIFYRKYRDALPFSLSTYWLLLCINLVLVVSGAGSLAFDLPL